MDRILASIWQSHNAKSIITQTAKWSTCTSTRSITNHRLFSSTSPALLPENQPSTPRTKKGFVHIRARAKARAVFGPRGSASRFDGSSARSIEKALKSQTQRNEAQGSGSWTNRRPRSAQKNEENDAVRSMQMLADEDIDNAKPAEPRDWNYWRRHKAAINRVTQGEAWAPTRRKLSPDTMEGIRAMHAAYPEQLTTPVLAKHFEVSPEAIRRILKSKWKPTAEEDTKRRARWEKRGKEVWERRATEFGYKVPKKWQDVIQTEQNSGSSREPGKAWNSPENPALKFDKSLSGRGSMRASKPASKPSDGIDPAWWKENVAASIANGAGAIPEL